MPAALFSLVQALGYLDELAKGHAIPLQNGQAEWLFHHDCPEAHAIVDPLGHDRAHQHASLPFDGCWSEALRRPEQWEHVVGTKHAVDRKPAS